MDPVASPIVWLGEPASRERSLVGGKMAHLGSLAAEFRVPSGFCLTTAAFERWAHAVDDAALAGLREAVAVAYRRLGEGEDVPVAVRSSAVDEDGGIASFAGQHETFLNAVGVDAVVDAVVRCWRSAQGERARAYRRQHGRDAGAPLAVLVQRLVAADVSAVAFSADPVTGERGRVVINASWGLGESIVGGTVTPDTYVVTADGAVLDRVVADKRRMTVALPGGVREVDVPRLLSRAPALDDARAVEIARLAAALEGAMGWPVDVECAFGDNTLYLLQCRPITTLAGAPEAVSAA